MAPPARGSRGASARILRRGWSWLTRRNLVARRYRGGRRRGARRRGARRRGGRIVGSRRGLLHLIADRVGLVALGREREVLGEHRAGARRVVVAVAVELAEREVGIGIVGLGAHQHRQLALGFARALERLEDRRLHQARDTIGRRALEPLLAALERLVV